MLAVAAAAVTAAKVCTPAVYQPPRLDCSASSRAASSSVHASAAVGSWPSGWPCDDTPINLTAVLASVHVADAQSILDRSARRLRRSIYIYSDPRLDAANAAVLASTAHGALPTPCASH